MTQSWKLRVPAFFFLNFGINTGKSVLTQKCDDVINTQQAGRSEWNETRDMLGFNTEPADSENPTTCQSI